MRALLGPLVSGAAPGGRAHIGAAATQHPARVTMLADHRLENYLAARPFDSDIIGSDLIVVREGRAADAEQLDELCRDALLLHTARASARACGGRCAGSAVGSGRHRPAVQGRDTRGLIGNRGRSVDQVANHHAPTLEERPERCELGAGYV